ncbi:MAG: hypothetical protein R3Y58_13565 [Eubacteriales bacterium]
MNESECRCLCPLCDKQITVDDCFMISFVAEESAPAGVLPDFINYYIVKSQKQICIGCKFHPK